MELYNELEAKGLTIEQYRSAVLDTFMYLDFFTTMQGYDATYYKDYIANAKTLGEVIDILDDIPVYTSENGARYKDYLIVKDAIQKDPALANFSIEYMSRLMEEKKYNEGTNGIVFQDTIAGTVYVAFRGTSRGEWLDDGKRFSVKSMDQMTTQMEQTIDFFETVGKEMNWNKDTRLIVTGHSQGGNDCQVVTLMTDMGHYVDQCFSFDGEGHSPELLKDVKNYLLENFGPEEYQERVNKMYSICGEYDFVNHLGEKVIPEKNTKYIHCEIDGVDKCHDIVSMFCEMKTTMVDGKEQKEYIYSGTINTSVGTSPSFVVDYTAKVWEEIYEMPYSERTACQDALMNIMEVALSGGKSLKGINGEHANAWDYYLLYKYGLDALAASGVDTFHKDVTRPFLDDAVSGFCDQLADSGWVSEKYADNIETIMQNVIDSYDDRRELKRDYDEYFRYCYPSLLPGINRNIKCWEIFAETGNLSYEDSYHYLMLENAMDYAYRDWQRAQESFEALEENAQEDGERVFDFIKGIWEQTLDNNKKIFSPKTTPFIIIGR